MKEIWKDIPTYKYSVSNIGNVYSIVTNKISCEIENFIYTLYICKMY